MFQNVPMLTCKPPVARRVAAEMNATLGQLVGYTIRFEGTPSPHLRGHGFQVYRGLIVFFCLSTCERVFVFVFVCVCVCVVHACCGHARGLLSLSHQIVHRPVLAFVSSPTAACSARWACTSI